FGPPNVVAADDSPRTESPPAIVGTTHCIGAFRAVACPGVVVPTRVTQKPPTGQATKPYAQRFEHSFSLRLTTCLRASRVRTATLHSTTIRGVVVGRNYVESKLLTRSASRLGISTVTCTASGS